jgi:very-short-patch-repair endonuclease
MQKNNPELRRLSQQLRRNMTRQERHLWYDYLSQYPVRFVRQHPLAAYIVDFYCAKAKLVVELDGSQHFSPEAAEADAKRSADLERLGITVIRFPNNAVDRYFEGVCEAIDLSVQARLSGSPAPEFPVDTVMW